MNSDSSGAMNCDEQRYSKNGLSGARPTLRQNSSRVVLGRRANHWSYTGAPVAITCSGRAPCMATASRFCASFQTNTRSGSDADEALVGQVVPAVHAQPAVNAERARRLDVLDLIGSDVDERRDQDHVGLCSAMSRRSAVRRNRALDHVQRTRDDASPAAMRTTGNAEDAGRTPAPARPRARAARRILVLGRLVADVVGAARTPRASPSQNRQGVFFPSSRSHVLVVVGQFPQQAPVAELVLHHEHEVDVMAAPRQLADRRRVISQRPRMAHREQDLHLVQLPCYRLELVYRGRFLAIEEPDAGDQRDAVSASDVVIQAVEWPTPACPT